MKMKRILTGMLGAAILAAGVNLLSVQAAENAGVMGIYSCDRIHRGNRSSRAGKCRKTGV